MEIKGDVAIKTIAIKLFFFIKKMIIDLNSDQQEKRLKCDSGTAFSDNVLFLILDLSFGQIELSFEST